MKFKIIVLILFVSIGLKAQLSSVNQNISSVVKILPFGESTTDGAGTDSYRKGLSDSLKAFNVAFDYIGSIKGNGIGYDTDHQGMNGNNCEKLSNWIRLNSSKYVADIILLLEGTNDCGGPLPKHVTSEQALSQLIDTICKYQPNAEVFVSTIPMLADHAYVPTYNFTGGANARATIYNSEMPLIINKKVAQGKRVHFVDTRDVIMLSDLNEDGIHPNQNGYHKMVPYWFNAIKPYLRK